MTDTPTTSARERLSDLRQAAAEARAKVDSLLARARNGEQVSGQELATARADLELADLPIDGAETAAAAEQETERQAANAAAADEFIAQEKASREAFTQAAREARDALRRLRSVADQHSQVVAYARQHALNSARPGDRISWNNNTTAPVFTVIEVDENGRRPRRVPGGINFESWLARISNEVRGPQQTNPNLYPVEAQES